MELKLTMILSNCGNTELKIGDNMLIHSSCTIFDPDFHFIKKDEWLKNIAKTVSLEIKNNVFIGNNVTILKGVSIGENIIFTSGPIVSKDTASNCIASHNPAKKVSKLEGGV